MRFTSLEVFFVNNDSQILGTQGIGRLLFRLSLPSAIGMIVMASYNIVDAIFIGRGVGSLGLAAVAVCFPLQMLSGALAVMGGIGGASIISRNLGAGDMDKAQKTFGTTIAFASGMGMTISILGLAFLPQILRLFGATPSILPHAASYLSVIFFGVPFQMFAMAGNNVARAEGKARIAMTSMLISAIMNMILDPIFIFGFGWGMKGAAIATVLSQMTMFVWIFGYFYRGRSSLHFLRSTLVPELKILREIVAIGMSEFTRMAAGSLSIVLVNAALIRWGGDMHVAVYGVINRAMSFFFMPLMGIAQGFQPILGYNYGAGNMGRARESIRLAVGSATVLSILGFAVVNYFSREIFRLFSTDETLIMEGIRALRLISRVFFLIGFQITGSAMFQALGKARPAFILSLSRQVLLLIPLVLVLPNFLGTTGVWVAFPLSDGLSFCLTLYLFLRELARLRSMESNPI